MGGPGPTERGSASGKTGELKRGEDCSGAGRGSRGLVPARGARRGFSSLRPSHVSLRPPHSFAFFSPPLPPQRGREGREAEREIGPEPRKAKPIRIRPQIRRDNPLNLSILLSGGKETNKDSLSSGERRGKSPAPNPRPAGGRGKCGVRKTACPVSLGGLSPSDRGSARGRCEAGNGPRRAGVRSSRSRVVWECSPKRVVNSI